MPQPRSAAAACLLDCGIALDEQRAKIPLSEGNYADIKGIAALIAAHCDSIKIIEIDILTAWLISVLEQGGVLQLLWAHQAAQTPLHQGLRNILSNSPLGHASPTPLANASDSKRRKPGRVFPKHHLSCIFLPSHPLPFPLFGGGVGKKWDREIFGRSTIPNTITRALVEADHLCFSPPTPNSAGGQEGSVRLEHFQPPQGRRQQLCTAGAAHTPRARSSDKGGFSISVRKEQTEPRSSRGLLFMHLKKQMLKP